MAVVKASDVAHSILEARASADTTIPDTIMKDIAGAAVTFSTSRDDVECVVYGVFDVTLDSGTPAPMAGYLEVDDVVEPQVAVYDGVSGDRKTVSQVWYFTLDSAGSHTLKLQAGLSSGSGGTFRVRGTHSGFVALIYDETT